MPREAVFHSIGGLFGFLGVGAMVSREWFAALVLSIVGIMIFSFGGFGNPEIEPEASSSPADD